MTDWTVATLHEHLSRLREADQLAVAAALASAEKAVAAALAASEKAVLKAEAASADRFASVNEFRQTLTDQAATFATRDKVEAIENRLNRIDGEKSGVTTTQVLMFQLAGLFIAAVGLYLALSR